MDDNSLYVSALVYNYFMPLWAIVESYHPKVLQTIRCTIARGHAGHQAKGDSALGRQQHRRVIDLTFAHRRLEIVVLLPNQFKT